MAERKDVKPHIYLGATGKAEPFVAPSTGGGSNVQIPAKNRQQHGATLQAQLQMVSATQTALTEAAEEYELESPIGIQIAFESFPGVALAVESLADSRQHIELMNTRETEGQFFATVFFPEGKLHVFESKLKAYLEERKDKNGKPRDNQKLIDAIQSFRVAALEALWMDDEKQWPVDANETFWWEAWLPVRGDRQAVIHDFTLLAKGAEIEVSSSVLEFPERSIMLAKGTRTQFARSELLLNTVSELRRAKEATTFFDELPPLEQVEWSDDLLARLEEPSEQSPYICILDTGVNSGHPLLQPFLNSTDQLAVEPEWDGADSEGHGTGMAGLAVWGDLAAYLTTSEIVRISHRLESVKVLRYPGDNEDKHLGIITASGVSLPEIERPSRLRVFAIALSSTDGRDRGRPSAWSSEIDNLASDSLAENENPRLLLVCAGNTDGNLPALRNYLDYKELQDIHDPGQAWNALTIGAYTEKVNIAESDENYLPLAPAGGLSPYSTTSVTWAAAMPIKPEVVFEGGNVGVDSLGCIGLPSLKLLTTHRSLEERHFTTFDATSAATALASRFAASIYAQYPNLWPETVRALMVHSARWTDTMVQQFQHGSTLRQQAQHRVRCVGFGVPGLERALWSANNSLALIVEDQLQPYEKPQGKAIRTRDMHLHALPWPKESLEGLGETEVEMTVTLSYFIEPNPSSRNVSGKYSYPSHQLRFDVKRPTESVDAFRKRINRQARDAEEGTTASPSDPDWLLGSQFRHRGSIHKDVWTGKAVELAERGQIAVYPAMGWWRSRTKLERFNKTARYALIVSIAVPEVEVDLYNEITTRIAVEAQIDTAT